MNKLQDKLKLFQQKKIIEYWKENKLRILFNYIDEVIEYPSSLDIYRLMEVEFTYQDLTTHQIMPILDNLFNNESVYLFVYSYSGINNIIESYPAFKIKSHHQDLFRFLLLLEEVYLIRISNLDFSKVLEISNLGNISTPNMREIGVYNI